MEIPVLGFNLICTESMIKSALEVAMKSRSNEAVRRGSVLASHSRETPELCLIFITIQAEERNKGPRQLPLGVGQVHFVIQLSSIFFLQQLKAHFLKYDT